jgi:Cof subfamily protein (haloacid dehalogenase superfamily)
MPYSAVYFDLDGTLLDDDGRVPPVVWEAIARVKRRGVRIGIATGRRATTTKAYAEAIGVDAPCVLFNGARVVEADFQTALFHTTLPRISTRRVIERVLDMGVHVAAYVDERMLTDHRVPAPASTAAARALSAREPVDLLSLPRAATKLLFVDEPERLHEVRRMLVQERLVPPGAHLVRSNPRFLELLPDGVNKGTALWRCAAHLGVDVASIVAFGDEENDREMLEAVGRSYAMGHAPADVRAVASGVVGGEQGANDGRALAATLDEVFG